MTDVTDGGHGVRRGRTVGSVADVDAVFIVGYPRSGTTLLGQVLGELDDVVLAGEVRNLWRRVLRRDSRCGCGARMSACPFWTDVFDRFVAKGGPSKEAMALAQRRAMRPTTALRLLVTGEVPPAAQQYAAGLGLLYRSVAEVSGAHTVVDTSKWPASAALVARLDGVSATLVHVVRDPRKVVASRTRRRHAGRVDRAAYEAVRWTIVNLVAAGLVRRAPRSRRVVFERFVADPGGELAALASAAGLTPGAVVDGHRVIFTGNHMVAGNRERSDAGPVDIGETDSWRRGRRRSLQVVVAPARLVHRALSRR